MIDSKLDAVEILNKINTKYKSIQVEKHLDLDIDVGRLLAIDKNELDKKSLKRNLSTYLKDLCRDNTQLLINKLWELPTERVDEVIVAKLPKATFVLPREKQVPKPKPLTKWQEYSKEKGLQKKKKSKLTWDEQLQKWIPSYGYRKNVAEKEKEWVIEVPKNIDPMTNMFEKKIAEKSERIAKNDLQRMRNVAKTKGIKVPRFGIPSSDQLKSTDLHKAATVARSSTASVGKFQSHLPKEKDARGRGVAEITPGVGQKRKSPMLNSKDEKKRNLSAVDAILNKKPKLNLEKAVSTHIYQEQRSQSESKQKSKPPAGRRGKSKKGGGGAGGKKRGSAKPTGGKGERNPNKRAVGRKRR